MKILDALAVAVTVLFFWWLIPSSQYIQPVAMTVHSGNSQEVPKRLRGTSEFVVEFVRTVPWGEVNAQWQSEIRFDGGQCPAANGSAPYEDIGLQPTFYPLNRDLASCVRGGEFFKVQRHWVKMWGVLRRLPRETIWECHEIGKPCRTP